MYIVYMLQVIKTKFQETYSNHPTEMFSLETSFDGDEIIIDVEEDGIIIDNYWELRPIYNPVVSINFLININNVKLIH